MRAFPHLRVLGKRIIIPEELLTNKTEFIDELIAIDPPIEKLKKDSFSLLDEELHDKLMLRKSRYNNTSLKNNYVEKYLRITSGPIIRNQLNYQLLSKKTIDRSYAFKAHSNLNDNNRKLNQIQENKRYDHPIEVKSTSLKVDQELKKISYSATSRMPPILNIKFLKDSRLPESGKPSIKSATTKFSTTGHFDEIDEKRSRKYINTLGFLHPATVISSKSATFSSKFNKLNSKNQNIIHLPALSATRNLDFNSEIVGRSISAVCKK